MKKSFLRVVLVLALSLTAVQPMAVTQTTQVAQAKVKLYSRKDVNTRCGKLRYGQTLKKVKKILGVSLGKKKNAGKVGGKAITEYKVKFYLNKQMLRFSGSRRTADIPTMGCSELSMTFIGGKLSDWKRQNTFWYVDENGNKIDDPITYYEL